MIKIKNENVMNFESALRGMRNPLESWDKSDSSWELDVYKKPYFYIGEQDLILATKLAKAGSDHGKFLRQIFVSLDITAPLYWWKEFDTYKVATVANSTSTMHKITSRNLTEEDFSWDRSTMFRIGYLEYINGLINNWKENKTEENFRMIIQDLLDSYNQTRTVTLNYAILKNMYAARKNHKLSEWREFCKWIKSLPYASELIIGGNNED